MSAVAATRLAAKSWQRWTTDCRIVTDPSRVAAAYDAANRLMDEIEAAIDRFNPASELNRLTSGTNPVSSLLQWFLRRAIDAARRSGGLVDPTAGTRVPHLRCPQPLAAQPGMPPDWRDIRIGHTTAFLPDGVRLDLGATGKAAAADLICTQLHRDIAADVLVSLGGDVATAGGPDDGWQVLVQDAADDPERIVTLSPGAAIATSSTLHRSWRDRDGVEQHHIIDPRTGASAVTPWRTATVVATSCVEANTASTAALVLGGDAPAWLAGIRLPARLVGRDGAVLTLNGFPEEC